MAQEQSKLGLFRSGSPSSWNRFFLLPDGERLFGNAFVLLLLSFSVFFWMISFGTAEAANYSFLPSVGSYHKGENFTVGILVNSDMPINAASGMLEFPTEYLEVLRVNKNDSILNLWVQEPSFSNAAVSGNVTFEGVILNPGFVGAGGKIINVVFRVKKSGSADLHFSRFSIYANDGLGTNLASPDGGQAHFTLLPEKPVQTQPKKVEESAMATQTPIIIIREVVKEVQAEDTGIIGTWKVLPSWIKILILLLIGLATIILVLIILSLGIIVLVWIWSNLRRKRMLVIYWLKRVPIKTKAFLLKGSDLGKSAKDELAGDVEYSVRELKKEVDEANRGVPFGKLIMDYLAIIKRIIERFFTRNDETDGPTPNVPDTSAQTKTSTLEASDFPNENKREGESESASK